MRLPSFPIYFPLDKRQAFSKGFSRVGTVFSPSQSSWSILTLLRMPGSWLALAIRIIRLHPALHTTGKRTSVLVPCSHHKVLFYFLSSKDMNHWVKLTTRPRILTCMSQWAEASKNEAQLNQEQVSAPLSTLHSIWIRFGAMSVDEAVLPGISKRTTRHPPSRKYLPPEDGDEARDCPWLHRGEIRVVGPQ